MQSWDSITLLLSPSYYRESYFSYSASQRSGLYSLFPFTSSLHPVIWRLLSLLSCNCSVWPEMACFLLVLFFFLQNLVYAWTSWLSLTLLMTLSYWNIFLSHCGDNAFPCFSHFFDCSSCPLNWLFFLLYIYAFRPPPGSTRLSWILSHRSITAEALVTSWIQKVIQFFFLFLRPHHFSTLIFHIFYSPIFLDYHSLETLGSGMEVGNKVGPNVLFSLELVTKGRQYDAYMRLN